MTNEAYKSRFIGAVPAFGPVVGKVMVSDNPYQTVNTDPYERLGSDYSRGIPRFRFARVPERFLKEALRRHIGTDRNYLRERPFE